MVEDNTNDADDSDKPKYRVSDRDRGILTQHDREYLLNERELDGQDERNARYRIRQRTIQALHDMSLLSLHASHDDFEQVADKVSHPELKEGVGLIHKLLAADSDVTETLDELERVVADGLHQTHLSPGDVDESGIYSVDASVDIDIEREQVEPDVPPNRDVIEGTEEAYELLEKINSMTEEHGGVEIFYPDELEENS